MVVVHHLNNSRSHRILWLLEELGVEYEIERYERNPATLLAPRQLRELHPLGKSPVITHEGKTIAESGAIIEYLLDTFDTDARLRPRRDEPHYYAFVYWLHYTEGSGMQPLVLSLIFSEMVRQGPFLAKPLLKTISSMMHKEYLGKEIDRHVGFWEETLSEHGCFVGEDFTAADIHMSYPLEAAQSRLDLSDRPSICSFLAAVRERDAYKAAVERGGPYDVAPRPRD